MRFLKKKISFLVLGLYIYFVFCKLYSQNILKRDVVYNKEKGFSEGGKEKLHLDSFVFFHYIDCCVCVCVCVCVCLFVCSKRVCVIRYVLTFAAP